MRILFLGLLCIAVLLFLLSLTRPSPTGPRPEERTTPTPTSGSLVQPSQSIDIIHGEKTYRIAWTAVPNTDAVTLLPNFTEKRTAQSLVESDACSGVVSGGFYTTDHTPTGLFIAQGTTLRRTVPNTLLNGYFSIDADHAASIGSSPPDGSVRLSLQTGPILIRDGSPVNLAIRDDEFARRVGVAITKQGTVMFLVIYNPENTWDGPKLADTPTMLSEFTNRIDLRDVLNLDGGSASAFIRDDIALQELTSVGSFFCLKGITGDR